MTTHLKGLRAENYKRLSLVDVTFDEAGGVMAIMGANEAGKSSLLDALESTLAGRKAQTFSEPIKNGADSARIVATFDDIIVERKFKSNGTTSIEVRGVDGRRYNSSEEVLRSLYSHVALDPLAFARLSDKEQVDTLLPLIGFDPAPLDAEREAAFEKRTDNNREVKSLENRLAALPDPVPNLPENGYDQSELADELARALGRNAEIEQAHGDVIRSEAAVTQQEGLVTRLRAELADAEEGLERHRTSLTAARAAANGLELVDVEPIRERIATATKVNEQIREQKERRYLEGELAKARAVTTGLTATLDDIKKRKAEALAAAKMPVPNLTVNTEDNVLMLAGVPFSQASTGVKIRTGTAIAMALNPALKLIVIRDASLLDEKNRTVIDELARDNEFLVLLEIADENSPVGIVIEEGAVREVRS